ncbi:MAG: cation diffusion facilitator family transporter [candidate division WOR-3 bacterium]|nr:cation diffusion facilitator family transporter [candidate division WOR-3 bacterium]
MAPHEHNHKHSFSERIFEFRDVEKKKLTISLVITAVVMVVEIVGGILSRSIALISDAGHMFTHAFAITISLVAIIIAARPPCHHRTFGLYRAEILAAFINGLFLLAVGGLIIYEAIERIINPEDILALDMLLIALVGLVVNIVSIFILHGSHKRNINIKGVFYHMIADAASSVGIVVAAIIIYYTKWNIIDPLVSIGISLVIVFWAWGILKESAKILLEMAPTGLNVDIIIQDLKKKFPEIKQLEHAHLWTITADMLVFSAHILLDDKQQSAEAQNRLISKINSYLARRYHIIESTVQILCEGDSATCPLIPEHNH